MTRLIDRARKVSDWMRDVWRDPANDLYWRTTRHGVGLMVGIWIGYAVTRPGMAWACWALLALTVLDVGVTEWRSVSRGPHGGDHDEVREQRPRCASARVYW